MLRSEEKPSTRTYIPLIASLVFSLFSTWSLIRLPGNLNPVANVFRGYFPSDQLSYAGIAASAKAGQLDLVEPFTETGFSHYPSWWYKFIGLFASFTGLEVSAAWSILGFAVILGSVFFIGIAAWRITGKPWAPLVVAMLLWIGPLSSILFDNWFAIFSSHAVMWGPYGALYPLNGEAAGLALGSSALVLGFWTLVRPNWPNTVRIASFGLSALVLGMIANFQTYSFLTLTAVTLWMLAVGGLLKARQRRPFIAVVAAVVIVAIVGPLIRDTVGALPIYALMLLPTLPGIWQLLKGHVRFATVAIVAFAIGAAPQIGWVVLGTLSADPFLEYRVDQSGNLGVPMWAFLLVGSPVLLIWVAILRPQIQRRDNFAISLLVGWFIAFFLLSFNSFWGFGQEPYRFWIDSVIVFAFIAAISLPKANVSEFFADNTSKALTIAATLLLAASLWNVGGFRSYVSEQGNINMESAQLESLAELVSTNMKGEGLLSAEPCLDPRIVKIVTGAPIAFYHLGLAWPTKRAELDAVIAANNAGVLDINILRDAGVSYLVTDSTCPTGWKPDQQEGAFPLDVFPVATSDYPIEGGSGTLTLWQIL